MDLLWPGFLYLLGLIPILIVVYIWILRRRRRFAVRYSSLSLVRDALPKRSNWRRHIPFALFLLAISSLILALVRPVAIVISLPTLPDPLYPVGAACVVSSTGKLYRNVAGVWVTSIAGTDIDADSITAGQIHAGAIGATEIAAGAITVDHAVR